MLYPGRDDHPQAALAKRQMKGGGTLVTFEVKGGKAAAFKMANALSIIGISNNLGDAKSLMTHPATTTHQRLKPEARAELGISEGMVRLSVGLEDVDDLIEDLGQALDALDARRAPRGGVGRRGSNRAGSIFSVLTWRVRLASAGGRSASAC